MKNKIILSLGIFVAVIIYGSRIEQLVKKLDGPSLTETEVKTKSRPASFDRPFDPDRKPKKKRRFI